MLLVGSEVYAKVAQLFQHQDDLVQEFGWFVENTSASGDSISHNGHSHHHHSQSSASVLNPTNSASNSTSSNFNLPPGSSHSAVNFAHNTSHFGNTESTISGSVNSLSNNPHSSIVKNPANDSNPINPNRMTKRPLGSNQMDQSDSPVPVKVLYCATYAPNVVLTSFLLYSDLST